MNRLHCSHYYGSARKTIMITTPPVNGKTILHIYVAVQDSQGYGVVTVERIPCQSVWDAEERVKGITESWNSGAQSISAKGICIPRDRFIYACVHVAVNEDIDNK